MEKQTLIQKLFELKKKSIVLLRDEAAYNYKYADLSQIQDKIAPALEELKLLIIHSTQWWSVVTTIYDVDSDACISSSIEIGKIKNKREWDETDRKGNIIHVIEDVDQDPQAIGSTITYYRRYNILQLLDLKTQDDDGASSSPRAQSAQATAWPAEWIDRKKIDDLIGKIKTGEVIASSGDEALKIARTYYKVSKENAEVIKSEFSKRII